MAVVVGSGCGGDVDTMKCDDGWVRRVGVVMMIGRIDEWLLYNN